MHDRLTQSRRLAAWCGLLLYVLTAVAVPLADGWVHGTLGAAAEATHVENPDGKSHEPPSQHQDCTLCRVQSTLSLRPAGGTAVAALAPSSVAASPEAAPAPPARSRYLPVGSRAPPV